MKRPETGYHAEPWIEYADHFEKEIERLKAEQIELVKYTLGVGYTREDAIKQIEQFKQQKK